MPLSSRFLTFASSLEVFCDIVSGLEHLAGLLTDSSRDDLLLQNFVVGQCEESVTDDSSVDCV